MQQMAFFRNDDSFIADALLFTFCQFVYRSSIIEGEVLCSP